MTGPSALQALQDHFLSMPPVAAMQVAVAGYENGHLSLHAPLSANINDKHCAFGGSLTSLMTLAGWGLVTLQLEAAGLHADVFVADSEVRYLAPLYADLLATASAAEGESWDTFVETLRQRGRARIMVVARVTLPDGGIATEFKGRYVAIRKG